MIHGFYESNCFQPIIFVFYTKMEHLLVSYGLFSLPNLFSLVIGFRKLTFALVKSPCPYPHHMHEGEIPPTGSIIVRLNACQVWFTLLLKWRLPQATPSPDTTFVDWWFSMGNLAAGERKRDMLTCTLS